MNKHPTTPCWFHYLFKQKAGGLWYFRLQVIKLGGHVNKCESTQILKQGLQYLLTISSFYQDPKTLFFWYLSRAASKYSVLPKQILNQLLDL